MPECERVLRFSKTELLCVIGVALFVMSLFLPAAKMGAGKATTGNRFEVSSDRSTIGIGWFALGTLIAFSPHRDEASNLSAIAVLLNTSCLFTWIAVFNRWKSLWPILSSALIGLSCATVLCVQPYSGFSEVYFGYYLWLTAAIWIVLSPILCMRPIVN